MRQIFLLLILFITAFEGYAQKKDFNYKFYGFVRGELFYDSRENETLLNELFHMFPKDIELDPNGKDLNANATTGFYNFMTRLGLDVNGPAIWGAASSAKIEADFAGFSKSYTMLRIRHAYVNLEWQKSALLLGQTWHPLIGNVAPTMLNLSTGSPFQPFNRSPQIRYQYTHNDFQFTGAAIYQLIGMSTGPEGKNLDYQNNSLIPEMFTGVDYQKNRWLVGVGAALISLKPRTEAAFNEKIYKVNERITTVTYMAHAKYKARNYQLSAKSLYNQNAAHLLLLGGYGIASEDSFDGSRGYTPFRVSSTSINGVFGHKYQLFTFLGYSKNLGTTKPLLDMPNNTYGAGLNIDQLVATNIGIAYTLPHWRVGLEYSSSTAFYGEMNLKTGRVHNTHPVTNHRLFSSFMYSF